MHSIYDTVKFLREWGHDGLADNVLDVFVADRLSGNEVPQELVDVVFNNDVKDQSTKSNKGE